MHVVFIQDNEWSISNDTASLRRDHTARHKPSRRAGGVIVALDKLIEWIIENTTNKPIHRVQKNNPLYCVPYLKRISANLDEMCAGCSTNMQINTSSKF